MKNLETPWFKKGKRRIRGKHQTLQTEFANEMENRRKNTGFIESGTVKNIIVYQQKWIWCLHFFQNCWVYQELYKMGKEIQVYR